jgi:AcrR family transcriptional regulator
MMGIAERRQREREARISQVLDATRFLLLEHGFTGTTTKLIARQCELSEATLFFYFKNKDEILISLLFEGIDTWTGALKKIQKLKSKPKAKLQKIWKLFEKVRKDHPEYYLLSAYLAQPKATANISEDIRSKIILDSGANFNRLASLLEEITGRTDGHVMADTLWSCFLGLTVLGESRLNLDSGPHPTVRDFRDIFDILCKGFFDNQ